MDCFASLAMTGIERRARAASLREPVVARGGTPAKNLFIIFVDAIFTTLFERPFTNTFDVIAQMRSFACLYRAGNAD
jgi:hypothetical protein